MRFFQNPITQKRLARFKAVKRAYYSLWILIALYGLSLGAELLANNIPLYIRFEGKSYFPVLFFYPEDTFTDSGQKTRADYKRIARLPAFTEKPDNYMVFPPFPYGPYESIPPESLDIEKGVRVKLEPVPRIAKVDLSQQGKIARSMNLKRFTGIHDYEARGRNINRFLALPPAIQQAMQARFKNQAAPGISETAVLSNGETIPVILSLSPYQPRASAPRTVRLTLRQKAGDASQGTLHFNRDLKPEQGALSLWEKLSSADQARIREQVKQRFYSPVDPLFFRLNQQQYTAEFEKEDIRFPFRPFGPHFMGIDGAGRDVFARIFYGLRTSLSFGFLLVFFSMVLGILAGAVQGYYGGLLDITAQRFIEIWSAIPFLYVMILMGSIYGRSFSLLLFCYAIFNWIGISYYIRAEFLRLRKQPFVDAARCMGIAAPKILFKHIMPNAMIPVITFFPFSLVGAIGALAALDYLGFGLPPPTPSWGELLFQAQQYRWAWWLILYPSLALFIVMLCGVFVGEGIRSAYDPKQYSRME